MLIPRVISLKQCKEYTTTRHLRVASLAHCVYATCAARKHFRAALCFAFDIKMSLIAKNVIYMRMGAEKSRHSTSGQGAGINEECDGEGNYSPVGRDDTHAKVFPLLVQSHGIIY